MGRQNRRSEGFSGFEVKRADSGVATRGMTRNLQQDDATPLLDSAGKYAYRFALGIFIAPEREAINQCEGGQVLNLHQQLHARLANPLKLRTLELVL
eukprot:1436719-Amphidinium_carterae.1